MSQTKVRNEIQYTVTYGTKQENGSMKTAGMNVSTLKDVIAAVYNVNTSQIRVEQAGNVQSDDKALTELIIAGLNVSILIPLKRINYSLDRHGRVSTGSVYISPTAKIGDLIILAAKKEKISSFSSFVITKPSANYNQTVTEDNYSFKYESANTIPTKQIELSLPDGQSFQVKSNCATFYDVASQLDQKRYPVSQIVFYDGNTMIPKDQGIDNFKNKKIRVDLITSLRYKTSNNSQIQTIEIHYKDRVFDLKTKVFPNNPVNKIQVIDDKNIIYPDSYQAANLPAGSDKICYVSFNLVENQPIFLGINDISQKTVICQFNTDITLKEALQTLSDPNSTAFYNEKGDMFNMQDKISTVTSETLTIKKWKNTYQYIYDGHSGTITVNNGERRTIQDVINHEIQHVCHKPKEYITITTTTNTQVDPTKQWKSLNLKADSTILINVKEPQKQTVQINYQSKTYSVNLMPNENVRSLKERFIQQNQLQIKATDLIFKGYRDVLPTTTLSNKIIDAFLKNAQSTKTITYTLGDDCYQRQITIDFSTIKKDPDDIIEQIALDLGIQHTAIYFLPKNPIKNTGITKIPFKITKPKANIKFAFPDNSEIEIQNANDKDFEQIINLFETQHNIHYSPEARPLVRLNVWDIDVPKTGKHLQAIPENVQVKVIADNVAKLFYNGKTYYFSTTDTIGYAADLIKAKEKAPNLTLHIKHDGLELSSTQKMVANKDYLVEATNDFIFHLNGKPRLEKFDYLVTVDEIRNYFVTIFSTQDYKLIKDEIIISDGAAPIKDGKALLKDVKNINLDVHPNSVIIVLVFREGVRKDSLMSTNLQVRLGTTKAQLLDRITDQFNLSHIKEKIRLKYMDYEKERFLPDKMVIDESYANQTIIVGIHQSIHQTVKAMQRRYVSSPNIERQLPPLPEPQSKQRALFEDAEVIKKPPVTLLESSGSAQSTANGRRLSRRLSMRTSSSNFFCSYSYKTNLDDNPKIIRLPSDATIADLKEEIARNENTQVSNVSILQAGMKFEDTNILERLGLEDTIIFAYILSMEDLDFMLSKSLAFTTRYNDNEYDDEEIEEEEEVAD